MTVGDRQPRLAHVPLDEHGTVLLRRAIRGVDQAAVEAFEYENPDMGALLARALKNLEELAKYFGVDPGTLLRPGPS